MDEQQVLEVLRANSAAMNAHATDDRYTDTFTEDVVVEGDPLPGPVVGRAAVAQMSGMFYAAFPDLHFEVEREFSCGDQAAICWRGTGTHRGDFAGIPPTGRRVDYHSCMIAQTRDGKIARAWFYFDTGTLLRQLGVLPGGDQA
jgi:steroid delta-isomerase-like uncharacterized protein